MLDELHNIMHSGDSIKTVTKNGHVNVHGIIWGFQPWSMIFASDIGYKRDYIGYQGVITGSI